MADNKTPATEKEPVTKKKPKVIILESNDSVRSHTEQILSNAGWDVTCENVSKHALETLSQSKKRLFALFISNFKLPKMEGDDILQKVKSISPLTQRMFMVPSDESDSLISAINKAEIHACITTPYKDDDLILQAKNCYQDFKHALKKAQLKRVTGHQNKQMFKIAQKLKKKDATYKQQIDEKKVKIVKMRTNKRKRQNTHNLKTNINVSSLIERKGIQAEPSAYLNEFKALSILIKESFHTLSTALKFDPLDLRVEKILSKGKDAGNSSESAKNQTTPDTKNTNETSIENPNKKEEEDKSSKQEISSSGNEDKNLIDNETEDHQIVLIKKVLKSAIIKAISTPKDENKKTSETDAENLSEETEEPDNILNQYLNISISKAQTEALLKRIKPVDEKLPKIELTDLLDLLLQRQISYGILDDEAIETWLSKSEIDEITIAEGDKPLHGKDGSLKYHFETEFTNPGKINEDGTIDFRERGDIPYVSKGDLLAEKKPAIKGTPGISISGVPIPVDEVIDPIFVAGPGTESSEDGLSIFAAIDGQPHLDAMGSVTVNSELLINGDVDYETGNIDFKGNIIVKGIIKEGFTVKGINLTAQEIEGAKIELSGDLNVSAGITEADISTHGNIYAKFINHSNVMGFGDLNINKEIIDSNILLSGSCINSSGHIISSKITAKLGIEAGKIGTSASTPSKILVGIDAHLKNQKDKIKEALEISVTKSNVLKDEIKKLEDQDQELYQLISEKAHIQDRAQIEITKLKDSLSDHKRSNDLARMQQITKEIETLVQNAKIAEKELNDIFNTQDTIASQTELLKNQINKMEEKNKKLVLEKRAIIEFGKKEKPVPIVSVTKTITQDSIIKGPHSSLFIKEDSSRCKIQEIQLLEEGLEFHEMKVSDL